MNAFRSSEEVESRTRKAMKGVLKCDVTKDGVLTSGGDIGKFDCVVLILCLEAACYKGVHEYRSVFNCISYI